MRELALLSVVAPMYDEEGSARAFYDRVVAALGDLPFELVVVDDGSTDRTTEIVEELAAADERVKVVHLSRNFGHQPALTAASWPKLRESITTRTRGSRSASVARTSGVRSEDPSSTRISSKSQSLSALLMRS